MEKWRKNFMCSWDILMNLNQLCLVLTHVSAKAYVTSRIWANIPTCFKELEQRVNEKEISFIILQMLKHYKMWTQKFNTKWEKCLILTPNSVWKWVKLLSRVRLFATPWTVGYQAPSSMEFSRQEYWSGLPFPSPGDLPNPGIEFGSPELQADTLPSEPPGKPIYRDLYTKGSIYRLVYVYIHIPICT